MAIIARINISLIQSALRPRTHSHYSQNISWLIIELLGLDPMVVVTGVILEKYIAQRANSLWASFPCLHFIGNVSLP